MSAKPYLRLALFTLAALACQISAMPIDATKAISIPAPQAAPVPAHSATVTATWLNVRPQPSEHGGHVITQLPHGRVVVVLECTNGWARIGDRMYINSNFLSWSCDDRKNP